MSHNSIMRAKHLFNRIFKIFIFNHNTRFNLPKISCHLMVLKSYFYGPIFCVCPSETPCALMDPFLCFPFWNLMCFGGPKFSCVLMDPSPFQPSCVLMDPKTHVFWWTHLRFPPLEPSCVLVDPKTSCFLMDPLPHVFWWTLRVHQNTSVPKIQMQFQMKWK